ncbi:MAG: acetolactate synthase small subunit [Patescibacteria group bacterium]
MKKNIHQKERFIILISAINKAGVLFKILSLCRRKRYSLESVNAGGTNIDNIYNITLVMFENRERVHLILHQINKIIEVVHIKAYEPKDVVDKELVLLAVKNINVAKKLINVKEHDVNIRIINEVKKQPVLELIAEGEEMNHVLAILNMKRDVVKMVRSGRVALKI